MTGSTTKMLSRRVCELCMGGLSRTRQQLVTRLYSSKKLTKSEAKQKRNELFEEEKERQKSFIKRIEKIGVAVIGGHAGIEPEYLVMNKGLSTPYNCAMHLGDVVARRSVAARMNNMLYDMHTPLHEECRLEFLHMLEEDTETQNKIFWRTCSFVLGCVLENSFKDNVYVELCSFPKPNVESGSFVYDVDLKLPGWKPSSMELNSLSMEAMRIISKKMNFEKLIVTKDLALEMFKDNRFKHAQIPNIAVKTNLELVPLYRMGDHIDITTGPLLGNTSQIGRFSVTKMYDVDTEKYGRLTRVQGLALPADITVHSYIYETLCKAAQRKNTDGLHHYRYTAEEKEDMEESEKINAV